MDGELRNSLLRLVRQKFAEYPNVSSLADDIVQDAYVRLRSSESCAADKENYGWLSVRCMRQTGVPTIHGASIGFQAGIFGRGENIAFRRIGHCG